MATYHSSIDYIQATDSEDTYVELTDLAAIADSSSTLEAEGNATAIIPGTYAIAADPGINPEGDATVNVQPGSAVSDAGIDAAIYEAIIEISHNPAVSDSPVTLSVISVELVGPAAAVGAGSDIFGVAHKTIINLSGTAIALSGEGDALTITQPTVTEGISVEVSPGAAVSVDTGLFAAETVGIDLSAALSGSVDEIAAVTFGIDPDRVLTLFNFYIVDDGPKIAIPITSFQLVLYADKAAYLEVVVPGLQWVDEINSRRNGNLSLQLAYASISTLETLQEEQIVKVPIERVDVNKGIKRSVTLSGYETDAQAARRQSDPKTITLDDSWYSYRRTSSGSITVRLVRPHMYLQAGDTIQDNDSEFVADRITWVKSESYHHMEVSGALAA